MRTGKKLTALMERIAADEDFEAKLRKRARTTLAELGWNPEEIVSFAVEKRSACGTTCGCNANMGQGCGDKRGNIVSCPTGKPGSVYKRREG
jgi:hypothetical protein